MIAAVVAPSASAMSADQPLTFLVFPAFIWAALRLGPQGATPAVAVAVVIAVWAASNELGPFVEHSPTDSALNLQLYIRLAALTTLCLAAIVSERQRAALDLAESERREGERAAEERQRIARDLHDSASQSLLATTLHLRTAERALAREGMGPTGRGGQELDQVGRLTRGALAEIRAAIFELCPDALADMGSLPRWPRTRLRSAPVRHSRSRCTGRRSACRSRPGHRSSSTSWSARRWPTPSSTHRRPRRRSMSPRPMVWSRSRYVMTAAASLPPAQARGASACAPCTAALPSSVAGWRSPAHRVAARSFMSRSQRQPAAATVVRRQARDGRAGVGARRRAREAAM